VAPNQGVRRLRRAGCESRRKGRPGGQDPPNGGYRTGPSRPITAPARGSGQGAHARHRVPRQRAIDTTPIKGAWKWSLRPLVATSAGC
jgi:hypothetical protein